MKKILVILSVILAITSCKSGSVTFEKGNKKITSVEKSISSYSELVVKGSDDIIYEQKPNQKPYLRVETDENLQQYVDVQVKDGALLVSMGGNSIQPSKFKVYTNSESLSKVKIMGSGNITLKNEVVSTSLDISIAGSGNLNAENLRCDNLTISIAGSGNARFVGTASISNFSIGGSGNIDATDLITQTTTCTVGGSGDAKVYASEKLIANVKGSGGIKYKGNPKIVDKTVKGSGSISSF